MNHDYDDWMFPFGKHKGKTIGEIPTSYLDWLIGEKWFISKPMNRDLVEAIGTELSIRRRSDYEPPIGQDEEWDWRNK